MLKNKIIFNKVYSVVFSVLVLFCIVELAYNQNLVQNTHEDKVYPGNAVHYLHQHVPQKQMMSVWEWGGYLDWKFPEKKVFIDGRTLVWKHASSLKNESTNIYKENDMIMEGKIPLRDIVKKYDIDTLLFPINMIDYHIIKNQITNGNWILKYRDDVAVIYQKRT